MRHYLLLMALFLVGLLLVESNSGLLEMFGGMLLFGVAFMALNFLLIVATGIEGNAPIYRDAHAVRNRFRSLFRGWLK